MSHLKIFEHQKQKDHNEKPASQIVWGFKPVIMKGTYNPDNVFFRDTPLYPIKTMTMQKTA